MRDVPVNWVVLEEVLLLATSIVQRQVQVDVLLGSVDHTDEAQLERVGATSEHIQCVGASVHEVQLGEDTERAETPGVNGTRKLKGIRVGQVNVGGRDGKDNAVWRQHKVTRRYEAKGGGLRVGLGDVVEYKVLNLPLNVGGLIANRNLGQTGQVDEREVQDTRSVDLEVDGQLGDSLENRISR